jgi:hypothetical protein
MGTSNFFSRSGYYFCSTSEDSEFEVDIIKHDINEFFTLREYRNKDSRNSEYIGTWQQSDILGDTNNEVIVYMDIYINFGYYAGYNIDFEFSYYFGNLPHGSKEIEYIPKELDFETDSQSWLLGRAEEITDYMEKEFIMFAKSLGLDELEKVATFSNGETIYQLKK